MKFLVVIATIYVINPTFSQTCPALEGTWQNELGSQLVIEQITADQQIIGTYKSSSGVDGESFSVLGWVNNYQSGNEHSVSISFTVRWEGYASITSWTGSCDADEQGPFIKTLWHLVRPDQQFPWERIISNSSIFRPLE